MTNSYRLVPVTEQGEDNPIINEFSECALDKDSIARIIEVIPDIKQFMRNAKLENKLSLLTGEFVGKENEVYLREKTLDWFMNYLELLPKKISEARQAQILQEAEKQNSK